MNSNKENQKSNKRSLKRFMIWSMVFVLVLFVVLTIYAKFYWKDFLISGLSHAFKRNVTISDIYYHPPLGLSAYKVNIDGFLKSDAAIIDFSFSSFFQRKIIVSDFVMVRPEIMIVNQVSNQAEQVSTALPAETKEQSKVEKEIVSKPIEFFVKKIFIEEGKLKYSTNKVDSLFEFALEDLRFKAKNISFPFKSEQTTFVLSGRMASDKSPLSNSKVEASGWIDLAKKDMDGVVRILESENHAALSAHAVAKDNLMKVDGQLDMNQLPVAKDQDKESNINQIVYSALSNVGVKIGANFSFETKLDDFEVHNVSFSGSVIAP